MGPERGESTRGLSVVDVQAVSRPSTGFTVYVFKGSMNGDSWCAVYCTRSSRFEKGTLWKVPDAVSGLVPKTWFD